MILACVGNSVLALTVLLQAAGPEEDSIAVLTFVLACTFVPDLEVPLQVAGPAEESTAVLAFLLLAYVTFVHGFVLPLQAIGLAEGSITVLAIVLLACVYGLGMSYQVVGLAEASITAPVLVLLDSMDTLMHFRIFLFARSVGLIDLFKIPHVLHCRVGRTEGPLCD